MHDRKKHKQRGREERVRFIPQRDVLGFEKFLAPVSYIPPGFNLVECTYGNSLLPSVLRRVVALIIDFLVIMLVFVLASIAFERLGEVPVWMRAFVFIFMWYLYDPVLTAYFVTLGQYVAGIRVRKYSDGSQRISLSMAIVRFIIKSPLGWISFITIPFTEGRRAVHDLLSGSIVLKK
ncbi:MAG: RDD family protein [Flavobacteriales bacterium]